MLLLEEKHGSTTSNSFQIRMILRSESIGRALVTSVESSTIEDFSSKDIVRACEPWPGVIPPLATFDVLKNGEDAEMSFTDNTKSWKVV